MRLPFILLSLVLFSACNNAEESVPAEAQPASFKPVVPTLPDLPVTTVNGQALSLASFRGKKVFVNLWATWCGPCREEIPSIQRLQAKLDSSKTAFVMLSLDDNFEQAVKYAANNKMTLPVYTAAAALPSLFQVQAIPATYVFNEEGELIYRKDGAFNYDTPYFTDLLGQKDTATAR